MASTSGRPSTPERRRRSSPAAPADDPVIFIRAGDALAAEIIAALKAGDVDRMKRFDKGLRKTGSSLLQAVAAAKPASKEVVDSLLHLAVRWIQYEASKYLIKDLRLDTNAIDEYAIEAMDSAITSRKRKESERIVELLIRRGANPNKSKPDGFSPLHAAIVTDSFDVAKFLLENGAQVNSMCQSGTVLHIAAESGTSVALVKHLLHHGANPNTTNISGFTALHVAVGKDYLGIAELLLKKKADVNAICAKGTALLIAIETGASVSIVKKLLEHHADPNITNTSGFTGLHFATQKDSYEVAELLLLKRAYVDAACEKGTSLHIAAGRGSLILLKLLLQHNASSNISDPIGRKAIEVAAMNEFRDCVELLFTHTSPIVKYSEWSIDGIMRDAKTQNQA